MADKQAEFERLGGRKLLEDVGKVFYDKIYSDPWLKNYFHNVEQEHIERQQVNFMQAALGGDNIYAGKTPPHAHKHIYITDEVFKAREDLLMEAFKECNVSEEMIKKWLLIENAFYKRVIKHSIDECEQRYPAEGILDYPRPS